MVVYVDILFMVNFLMDLTIVWAAGMLLRLSIKPLRLIAGAALSGVMYIIVLYMPYGGRLIQLAAVILPMTLSVIIAYRPKNIKELVIQVLICTAVSFAAAGIIFMVMCFKSYGHRDILSGFSYKILVLSSVSVYIAIKLGRDILRKTAGRKEYYDIRLCVDNRSIDIRALADSGNSLRDELGGNEIIIADCDTLKPLFPPDFEFTDDAVGMFSVLSATSFKTRIRLIPFKSLGNPNGLMLGLKADLAEMKGHESRNNIIIGIYCGRLDAGGRFNAIINNDTYL